MKMHSNFKEAVVHQQTSKGQGVSEEKMLVPLAAIKGAFLYEILVCEAAIRLDFAPSPTHNWQILNLKTANTVSLANRPEGDYQAEMLKALPILYSLLGFDVDSLSIYPERAELKFVTGQSVWIADIDGLWDNLFAIELRDGDNKMECFYK
jgi:hypothetical protein